ncbi:MAG: PrsW family glutamic-type intramembrane protease [Saprospiraceae bacterium]
MDKYEPEPVKLVLFSFLLGLVSFGLNAGIGIGINTLEGPLMSLGIKAFIEELCKFIIVLAVLYRNKNFNEPLDGIVYTVMVAMGFATAKNLMTVYSGATNMDILMLFTTILAHASFAALMGYLLGKAKFMKRHETWYIIAALALATLFHFIYDFFQFLSAVSGIWIGSIVALLIVIYLGKQAMDIHHKASPFKKD